MRPAWNTAFEISLKLHAHYRKKPGIQTIWYEDEIFRLLRCKELFIQDEINALMTLVQYAIEQQPSLIHMILDAFNRQNYTVKYLLHGIYPIAVALKALLKKNSLSLENPPYNRFFSNFEKAINNVPAPTYPRDYSFSALPNKELKEFFLSNIKHELILEKNKLKSTTNAFRLKL